MSTEGIKMLVDIVAELNELINESYGTSMTPAVELRTNGDDFSVDFMGLVVYSNEEEDFEEEPSALELRERVVDEINATVTNLQQYVKLPGLRI